MKINNKLKCILPVVSLISCVSYANEISLNSDDAGIKVTINTEQQEVTNYADVNIDSLTATKTITLMKMKASQVLAQKADFASQNVSELDYSKGINPVFQVDLGMGDVPVLDQGTYGTCVTFASTAVTDATIKKADFIDQQCSLGLNKTLGHNYWNGANKADEIIQPLIKYGIVEKNKCNAKYPSPSTKISVSDYKSRVTKDTAALASLTKVKTVYYPSLTLDQVKAALDQKHRVAIGFYLIGSSDPISVEGFNITVNGKNKTGGLWACKQGSSSNYCISSQAGHEVVVIGYDDAQQLLKIRNSWNTVVGDQGNFYMTYAFFNAMALDGTEVY